MIRAKIAMAKAGIINTQGNGPANNTTNNTTVAVTPLSFCKSLSFFAFKRLSCLDLKKKG